MISDRQRATIEKLNQLSDDGLAAVEGYIEFVSACERAKRRSGRGAMSRECATVNSWGEPEDLRPGPSEPG
jgi:hypothetical protein